jgi:hypothetical protein
MFLGVIEVGNKGKNCNVTPSNFCYISRSIKNPSGKQTFHVATIATHIKKDVKVAKIAFKA